MLFSEEDLRLVRRTLEASGITNYATPFAYTYRAGNFSCEWLLAPAGTAAIESDTLLLPQTT